MTDASARSTTVTLSCGHDKDYTGQERYLPNIGDPHPCVPGCDWPALRRVTVIRQTWPDGEVAPRFHPRSRASKCGDPDDCRCDIP